MQSHGRLVAAKITTLATISVIALTACAGGSTSPNATEESTSPNAIGSESYKIVVMAASSQNGYSQAVYQGIQEAAKASGVDIELQLLDGQFDANTQLSQMQNATTSGNVDGVIVVPNGGPSLAAAFPLATDTPVVSVLVPIGPDIEKMEPQVEGVVSTVAVAPSAAAAKQAEGVVDYCADINPCKVVLLMGFLASPLDVARLKAYNEVLSKHDNIKVVATTEGKYDPDASLTAMTNVLQGNPDINVVLSNADQNSAGAQIALEAANIDVSSIYITGAGGTTAAVAAVRDGSWKADYLNFPVSMGRAALEQLLNHLQGKDVESWVDADTVGGIEPFATKETLDKTPEFLGERDG